MKAIADTFRWLVLLSSVSVLWVAGCEDGDDLVQPQNQPPDTYVLGDVPVTSAGRLSVRIFWYGTDVDGEVVRFGWALADTGNGASRKGRNDPPIRRDDILPAWSWTTATETTFVFTLPPAPDPAFNPVVSVVAVDDDGAMDPTPAAWYVLGTSEAGPALVFQKSALDGTGALPFADGDTIGFGESFRLSWEGSTSSTAFLPAEAIARLDTVAPLDGLLGVKYRFGWEECDGQYRDCWRPRRFDEASGDSISYFAGVYTLAFPNDGSDDGPTQLRLASGRHQILFNALDIVGLQIPEASQPLNLVVNFDPQTRMLVGETDPFNTDDLHVYPYYLVYYPSWAPGGERVEEHAFAPGDTVPDRAVVVMKALGRDDPRDQPLSAAEDWEVLFQGKFDAVGALGGSVPFPFATNYSEGHWTPGWTPAERENLRIACDSTSWATLLDAGKLPRNYAAVLASKQMSAVFCEMAEEKGYSKD